MGPAPRSVPYVCLAIRGESGQGSNADDLDGRERGEVGVLGDDGCSVPQGGRGEPGVMASGFASGAQLFARIGTREGDKFT